MPDREAKFIELVGAFNELVDLLSEVYYAQDTDAIEAAGNRVDRLMKELDLDGVR